MHHSISINSSLNTPDLPFRESLSLASADKKVKLDLAFSAVLG